MNRTVVLLKTGDAWYQVRWLWMWWTVKFKVGSVDEIMDWAMDQNAPIVIIK